MVSTQASARTDLVVYTAFENEGLKDYKQAFEKDNPGINIIWVRDSTGIVTAKLMAERESPRADVVWGLAATSMLVLDDLNMLQGYAPKGLDKLSPKFRDPRNPPQWIGQSGWVCAIVFNDIEGKKKGVAPPATWKDLLNPAFKGQISMPHPASSGTGYMYVTAWMQLYGEQEAWKFMDALHQNIARYTHSGSSPAALAGKGEYMVGLAFDTRGVNMKKAGAPISIIMPKEGLGWDMNAIAIIKGTKKLDAAKKLLDWTTESEAANRLHATRTVAAVQSYVQQSPILPINVGETIMDQDFGWAAKNRPRILAEWEKRYGSKAEPKK